MRLTILQLLAYPISIILTSCSLLFQTVRIEVTAGYVGWVYVISTKDTTGNIILKEGGKFRINENGVAYVPFGDLNIKKDSRILVYEEGKDISDDMRYAGTVTQTINNGKSICEFIRFYLPSKHERKIADDSQYWRDKMYEYMHPEGIRFDSLLAVGILKFK